MRQPNTTFDIYLSDGLAMAGATGHLRSAYALSSEASEPDQDHRWTDVLEVPLALDVRDDWPATPSGTHYVLVPAETSLQAGERQQKYTIVEVERERRLLGGFKRVYLKRESKRTAIMVKDQDDFTAAESMRVRAAAGATN